MVFKKWLEKQFKAKRWENTPEGDFVADCLRECKMPNSSFRDFDNWEELKGFLSWKRAIPSAVKAGRNVYNAWIAEDPKAKVDGMSAKDVAALRRVTRQVWSWSHPKRICLKRATDSEGFHRCEKCKKRVPKVFIDHIIPVGDLDFMYFDRLFCSSKGLQALCKKCHDAKTREERKAAK